MIMMALHATKQYGDIIILLEALEEKINTEIETFQQEFSKKYSVEITRDIMQYISDFLRVKINLIIRESIKEFSWYNIIIDCTEINLNLYEIEAILSRVRLQMKDIIPEDPAVGDLKIILKKYFRKVICQIPTRWTESVVLKFLKQFEETLNQLGITID